MNRFPWRCVFCSRCWLSSRTDMTNNKRAAGDDNSAGSDDFCQNNRIFGRRCPTAVERFAWRVRFRPMKSFLNLLREFGEIHLRDSRFSSKHNPISFNAAYRRVFVYLALSGFEVLGKCERRGHDRQNHDTSPTILHTARFCRFSPPPINDKMICTARLSGHLYGLTRCEVCL